MQPGGGVSKPITKGKVEVLIIIHDFAAFRSSDVLFPSKKEIKNNAAQT
jgi:hypothetical protein